MPAKYHAVSPTLWDRTMRELSGPAKVVRFYVMSCPARLSEGLFHLPLGHLIHDTGLKPEHVDQALTDLESAGLLSYDPDAEVVLDRTALKFAPLRNGVTRDGEVKPDNRIPGALRLFEQVPDSPLKVELYGLAREHSPDLAAALRSRFPDLDTQQQEAPPEPLASPSEGASRARAREELEQRREEPEKSRAVGDLPMCGWCGDTRARVDQRTGQVEQYQGRPWCYFCQPGESAGDAT